MNKFLAINPSKINKNTIAIFLTIVTLPIFLYLSKYLMYSNMNRDTGMPYRDVDFNAYITGALIFQKNPKDLYNSGIQKNVQETYLGQKLGGVLSFRNTPIFALLYIPYTKIPASKAYYANYFVQTSLTLFFILYVYRATKASFFMLPVALIFLPSIYQATCGQLAILIAITLGAIYYSMKQEKYFWTGIFSALLLLKIQYIVLIPFLLIFIKGKREYLAGLTVSATLLITIDSILFQGFYLLEYINFLANSEKYILGTSVVMLFNLTALLKGFNVSEIYGHIVSATLYILTFILIAFYKKQITLDRFFAGVVLITLSLTIHTALVDLIFLLIPMFLLSKEKEKLMLCLIPVLFLVPAASVIDAQRIAGLLMFIAGILVLFTNRTDVAVKTRSLPGLPK